VPRASQVARRRSRQMFGRRLRDAGIGPDVAAIASMAAEFDIVLMRRLADAKDANQFVLAAIERALARVGFVPDNQIERRTIYCPIRLRSGTHRRVINHLKLTWKIAAGNDNPFTREIMEIFRFESPNADRLAAA
jgi:hypothetical protein